VQKIPPDEKRISKSGVFDGFNVKGTSYSIHSRLVGWRITIMNQDRSMLFDCWVHDGRICSVRLDQGPPWNHQNPFAIGRPTKAIISSMETVILRAVTDWTRSLGVRGESGEPREPS
jgi:hypothetical protein